MGAVGKGTTTKQSSNTIKTVTDLPDYTNMTDIFKDVNFTSQQVTKLSQLFRGVKQYDKDYDGKPYIIDNISIEPVADKHIIVSMRSHPDTDSPIIKTLDTKFRLGIIGPRGALFNYNDNHKRVKIKDFDFAYGTKER